MAGRLGFMIKDKRTAALFVLSLLVLSAIVWFATGEMRSGPTALVAGTESSARTVEQRREQTPAVGVEVSTRADKLRTSVGEKAFVFEGNYEPMPGNASDVIKALMPLAKAGDADAALDIHMKISECRYAMNSNDPNGQLLEAYRKAGVDLETVARAREKTLDECASLVSDGVDGVENEKWLELAAENGSTYAKLLYAADPAATLGGQSEIIKDPEALADYRKKAVRFLEEAAETGSVNALLSLSQIYENGSLVRKDPRMAYAYYLAANSVHPRATAPSYLRALQQQATKEGGNVDPLVASILEKCCKS